jgi:hypothetical protein
MNELPATYNPNKYYVNFTNGIYRHEIIVPRWKWYVFYRWQVWRFKVWRKVLREK